MSWPQSPQRQTLLCMCTQRRRPAFVLSGRSLRVCSWFFPGKEWRGLSEPVKVSLVQTRFDLLPTPEWNAVYRVELRCVGMAFSTDVLSEWLTEKCVSVLRAGKQGVTNVPARETFTRTAGTCENHSCVSGVFTDTLTLRLSLWVTLKFFHAGAGDVGKRLISIDVKGVNTGEQTLRPNS